ncbi:ArgE/DapE family deacylase [Roseospira marina]|uniref:ArgE/DapE family deacylase n=1 Tax=Roseospira marina TaxID=140057 RepID=A0A5M6IAS3_9PROT|nr:ArgE/DapE family deacylase [Roseospira marina]KAA5605376.1 ArgE/DapE family deacylase [Roseospira marina]MBB4314638.1 acetylornithine deacetylase [Roseospira marina]MBB5088757.1 acetylornithine deacetylase [Roseospira marina]
MTLDPALDPALEAAVRAAVAARRDAAVDELCALVAEDSQVGREKGAQDRMAATFAAMGLVVDRFPVDLDAIRDRPGFSPPLTDYAGRPNVVGYHRPSAPAVEGRSLILNGHIDVVPPGAERLWSHPPFSPVVREGRVYGRGAGDMKAGIVAYCTAFQALADLGYEPAAPVILQSVIEEECTGNGALACLARGYTADAAIIPEPFGPSLMVGQLGVMWARIRVAGRPAHVLDTSAGLSALEAAYRLFDALRPLEAAWNEPMHRHPLYADHTHPVNFNLGRVDGGDWPSSVAAEATIDVRLGFYPGVPLEEVRRALEDTVAAALVDDPALAGIMADVSYQGFQAEGCVMDADHPMMTLLGDLHARVAGAPAPPLAVTCTTDARFFQLYEDIPATCYGPEATHIHGIDESVSIDSLMQVATVLALFMGAWCGLSPRPG